eukprot:4384218-Heterocapsa_arctica.AAC.1
MLAGSGRAEPFLPRVVIFSTSFAPPGPVPRRLAEVVQCLQALRDHEVVTTFTSIPTLGRVR